MRSGPRPPAPQGLDVKHGLTVCVKHTFCFPKCKRTACPLPLPSFMALWALPDLHPAWAYPRSAFHLERAVIGSYFKYAARRDNTDLRNPARIRRKTTRSCDSGRFLLILPALVTDIDISSSAFCGGETAAPAVYLQRRSADDQSAANREGESSGKDTRRR